MFRVLYESVNSQLEEVVNLQAGVSRNNGGKRSTPSKPFKFNLLSYEKSASLEKVIGADEVAVASAKSGDTLEGAANTVK